MHNIKPGKKILTKTCLFYLKFLFVLFSSKELIFVSQNTLDTERLVTSDCSVSALIYKSIFFLLSTNQIAKIKFIEDLTQTMVNLALKGNFLPKIELVNKTFNCTVYFNRFKYTGSIKNEPRKPKRRILSAR